MHRLIFRRLLSGILTMALFCQSTALTVKAETLPAQVSANALTSSGYVQEAQEAEQKTSLSEEEVQEAEQKFPLSGEEVQEAEQKFPEFQSETGAEELNHGSTVSDNTTGEENQVVGDDIFILSLEEQEEKIELKEHLEEILSLEEGLDYVPNEIIVEAQDEEQAEAYANAFGGRVKRFIPGKESFAVILLESVRGATEEDPVEAAVMACLSQENYLPPVWPNYYYYLLGEESHENQHLAHYYDDPYLKENSSNYQWHHDVISSPQAWAYGYTGKGVKVAVLDTGINSLHEDVAAQQIVVEEELGTEDANGHGTHVAALIGARGNNQLGGAGVAPEAQLLTLKIIGTKSGTTDTIMAAIQKAMENDADIINLSVGSVLYNGPFEEKIREAYSKGVAVFCAAGNDGTNALYYPGAYKGAIAVGALDKSNQRAGFSNYSSAVRYVAPGANILSATINGSNRYSLLSGTSQATPIMAGMAALILSSGKVEGQGSERVDQLLKLMDKSCKKVTGTGMGKGYIDLTKALGLDTLTGKPSAPVISHKTGTYKVPQLEVTLSGAPGSRLYYTLDGTNITMKDGVITPKALEYHPGDVISIEGSQTVQLKVRAVSNGNASLSGQVQATYKLKPTATAITIESATGDNKVAPGKSLQLKARLSPSYTADQAVKWKAGGTGITVSKGKVSVKSNTKPGEYIITATAKDEKGSYQGVSQTYTLQVVREDNPITNVIFPQKTVELMAGSEQQLSVRVMRKDMSVSGSDLVSWKTEDPSIAEADSSGGELILRGLKRGKTKLIGIAQDGHGKKVHLSITVKQSVESITISGNSLLAAGKSTTMKAQIFPEDANNKAVTWSIRPKEAAGNFKVKVSGTGKVSATLANNNSSAETVENETYILQATAKDGSQVIATHTLTITGGKMKSLQPAKKSLELFRVENRYQSTTKERVEITTTGANLDAWKAESNKPGLVEVEKEGNGIWIKATGGGTGTATITISSTDGSNLRKRIKVKIKNPPSQLKLAPAGGRSQYVAKGKKLRLVPVFETAYGKISAASKGLEWTSENPDAVKVDQKGNVTALKEEQSSVYITARTTDGSNLSAGFYVKTCSLTKRIGIKAYNENTMILTRGKAYGFEFFFENESSSDFNPSRETVVTRNKEGLEPYYVSSTGGKKLGLMANKVGTYRITVALKDGSSAKKTYIFKVVDF